jgi:hypothetical protein
MPGPVTIGRIIAVTELHQASADLDQAIAEARWRSWEAGATARNEQRATINWQLAVDDARRRLLRLYSS